MNNIIQKIKFVWKKCNFFLKLLITTLLVFVLLNKINLNETLFYFNKINWLILVPLAIYPLVLTISTIKWKLVLDFNISFLKLFKIYWVSNFFSNFLPSTIGGDSYKLIRLKEHKIKNIFTSILLDRGSGFFSLFLLLPFFLKNKIYSLGIWTVLIVFIFLVYYVSFKNKKIQTYQEIIKKNTKKNIKLIILSLLRISLGAISFYFYFLMFGYHLNFFSLVSIYILLQLISMIPVSLNGWGLREGSLVYFVGFLGVIPEMALAIALVSRLTSLIASGFGGVLFLFDKENKNK